MLNSTLERQQRGLLELVKGRSIELSDDYLRHVADSPDLVIVREIAVWWRAYQVELQCHFTSRLLKRLGSFEALVKASFERGATSAFVEELSRDFLRSLGTHADPLVRAVSQFELAVLEIRAGSLQAVEIGWDREPSSVLTALSSGQRLPSSEIERRYRMMVRQRVDGMPEVAVGVA